ncbi:MAG TPA: aminotransferase class V-fold PLP-dependent enzyme, partial [Myxococcaceae bacterium]|nr:aminotransferase class V-fold PLP-dependent enzyme [Myxococcaceae bacterium]
MKLPVYMDNHATTPLDPRVLEAMMPYLRDDFGNAASRNHAFGWKAEAGVEQARIQVAKLIGASEKEIVFTSGATESDNLAIKGVAEFYKAKGDHIITVKTEHKAVLDTCKRLERMRAERIEELRLLRLSELTGTDVTADDAPGLAAQFKLDEDPVMQRWISKVTTGARVTYLDVEADGRVSLEKLAAAMTDKTILVSI